MPDSFLVPPALIGMGLLFLLLVTGVIRTRQLEKSSQFFKTYGPLFLPIMAGVLQYWGILKQGGWYLMLTIVLSTAFVLIFTAFITTICKRGERPITFFLGPVQLAMVIPLYKHASILKKNLLTILSGVLIGTCSGILFVVLASLTFHFSREMLTSLAPKSVTACSGDRNFLAIRLWAV